MALPFRVATNISWMAAAWALTSWYMAAWAANCAAVSAETSSAAAGTTPVVGAAAAAFCALSADPIPLRFEAAADSASGCAVTNDIGFPPRIAFSNRSVTERRRPDRLPGPSMPTVNPTSATVHLANDRVTQAGTRRADQAGQASPAWVNTLVLFRSGSVAGTPTDPDRVAAAG